MCYYKPGCLFRGAVDIYKPLAHKKKHHFMWQHWNMCRREFHSCCLFPINEGLCSFMLLLIVVKKSFPSKLRAHRDKIIGSFENKRTVWNHVSESGLAISKSSYWTNLRWDKGTGRRENMCVYATTSFQTLSLDLWRKQKLIFLSPFYIICALS